VPAFHTVLPLDDVVVFHETTNGPFEKSDALLAEWAPSEPGALRSFLQEAVVAGGLPWELLRS
jgi:hypothetical protein